MRLFSSLLLSLFLVGSAVAQTNSDIRPGVKENPNIYNDNQQEEKPTKGPPAGAIIAAFACAGLVLVLVCYPTRKN